MNLSRKQYAGMFGAATVGDQAVADCFFIEVERDLIAEARARGGKVAGKVIRDGMDIAAPAPMPGRDLVCALILDAVQGVIKADIGIKGGRIVGLGHASSRAFRRASRRGWSSAQPPKSSPGKLLSPRCRDHAILRLQQGRRMAAACHRRRGRVPAWCALPQAWPARARRRWRRYPDDLGFLGRATADAWTTSRQDLASHRAGLPRDGTAPDVPGLRCGQLRHETASTASLNRSGFVEDFDPGVQRPHDSHVSQRRCGRRARAGHHSRLR